MTITWERVVTAIACLASLTAIIKAAADARKAGKKEIEDKATEQAEMRSNMKYVRDGIDEIKETQATQVKESRELCERVTRVEGKADEALRRIEEHERRGAK